jgi:oligosaccharide repeat unit polymerase
MNLILSYWNPYDLTVVNLSSYFLQSLGMFSMVIGYLIHPSNNVKIGFNKKLNINFQKSFFFKLNVIFTLCLVIYVLQRFYIVSTVLPKEARDIYFEELSNNVPIPFFKFIWSWYVPVIVFYVQVLFAVILITNNSINRFWSMIYGLLVISYLLIGFGRAPIQQFLYLYILLYLINISGYLNVERNIASDYVKNNFKATIKLSLVLVIAIIGMAVITNLRGITSLDSDPHKLVDWNVFAKQFITYNTGGFVAFDFALNNEFQYQFGPLYGSGTFASIDNLFYFIHKNQNYANNLLGKFLQERTIDIGADFQWNYAYTMFYIFYKDLGVLGLVLIPLMFGFLFKRILVLFLKTKSFYYLVIFVFLSYSLFYSNFAYALQSIASFFIISLSVIMHYTSKIKLRD